MGHFCLHDARFGGPILSSLPRHHNNPLTKCGCKTHCMDFHGDHSSTCTAHSGATKAHDGIVGVLGPLFRTAGHTVRTEHGRRQARANGAAMWRFGTISGVRPGAGVWSLTSASPMTVPPPACMASFCVFFFYRPTVQSIGCSVTDPRRAERTEQRNLNSRGVGEIVRFAKFGEESSRGAHRPHGVGTRRADANCKEVKRCEGGHGLSPVKQR